MTKPRLKVSFSSGETSAWMAKRINCKNCFKKSDPKLFRLAAQRPEDYDWNREMEQKYGWHGAPTYGVPGGDRGRRVFFRQYRSADDMIAQSRALGYVPTIPAKEVRMHAARQYNLDLDVGGCGESCEIYPMESA